MKKYVIPIVVKYWEEDWISKNQTFLAVKQEKITKDYVRKTIEEHLKKVEKEDKVEVAFSGIDTEQKEDLICVAYEYLKQEKIETIKVTTRPNCINKNFLKMLKKYKVKTIELEVGSTNSYILKRIGIDATYLISPTYRDDIQHAIVALKIKDEKYNLDGIYWTSRKYKDR